MFLIRTAFWLSVVILLLPADPDAGKTSSLTAPEPVGAVEAIGAARAALDDISGLCERRPAVCETGSAALQTFSQKAKFGARKLYEYLDEADGVENTGSLGAKHAG